jgi:hypothetical protein
LKNALATVSPSLRKAIRVAAKAGFLSRRIWNERLSHGHRSWKFRQWKALTTGGHFVPCREFGFTNDALILSRKGIETANSLQMDPVGPPGAKSMWHDDDLVAMALILEEKGFISNWITESELRNGRLREFFPHQDDTRALKFPDLVIQLKHPKDTVLWAIELERTRKEKTRYYDMVQSYSGTSRINAVLVVTATDAIEKNIQLAMNRLSHSQTKRPILFARHSDFLAQPDIAELRLGEKRSNIATAVQRWHQNSVQDSRNNSGNNVA